jgi:cytochrome c5
MMAFMKSKRTTQTLWSALVLGWTVVLSGCYYDVESELYGGEVCDLSAVGYAADIEPIISTHCTGCHGGAAPSGGLQLGSYAQVAAIAQSGSLVDRTHRSAGDALAMPPSGRLSDCQLQKIQNWVNQGAPNN